MYQDSLWLEDFVALTFDARRELSFLLRIEATIEATINDLDGLTSLINFFGDFKAYVDKFKRVLEQDQLILNV